MKKLVQNSVKFVNIIKVMVTIITVTSQRNQNKAT